MHRSVGNVFSFHKTKPSLQFTSRYCLMCVYLFVVSLLFVTNVLCASNQSKNEWNNIENLNLPSSHNITSNCIKCNSGHSWASVVFRGPRPGCLSGHYLPVLQNSNCDCDFVCARESLKACRLSQKIHPLTVNPILCDPLLKLRCDEHTNQCKGDLSLEIFDIHYNFFRLNWTTQGSNSSQIFIGKYDSILFPNETVLTPVNIHPLKISEFKYSAKIENLKENSTYLLKVSNHDHEEYAIVQTKGQSLLEHMAKVLVTHRNASSVTIAFDDFKPTNHDSGYVINYRTYSDQNIITQTKWNVAKSNSTPFYILNGLKPNTTYEIQVSTWKTFDVKSELRSEIVKATTLEGCFFDNKTFEIGAKVVDDCDQICTCLSDNNIFCNERCKEPYISAKVANVKNLHCNPQSNDECCVQCESIRNNTDQKFIDKPGICPNVSSTITSCGSECVHDYHCTGIKKCCPNDLCALMSCQAPINVSISVADCPLECGSNAQCKFVDEESSYKCVCLEGFTGDEPMHGCHRKEIRLHQCDFENKLYDIGQSFEHKCHICVCSEALEIECKPKCRQFNQSLVPNHCKLVPDLYDPICCQKELCDFLPHVDQQNSSLLRSGCRHLNHTYNINETFMVGCELKCLCKHNGEVECVPRCFENPGYDENFCYFTHDPDDPECCKIAVCNHNETDFKEDIFIEMAESVNSTAIKLKLSFNSSDSIDYITLNYKKIINESLNWTSKNITSKMLLNSKEIELTGLEPETDYSIYFQVHNESSNTVVVRTFPPGIDHTFQGCFHGSQVIEVGEIFFEGDCEYKCICREGGLRECVERCPVFFDLIGYEKCQWVPSPEDSCCTLPVCENDQPTLECIAEDLRHFKVGDTWTVGTGCLKRTCNCVMVSNNSTEIKCKGGCPSIPPSVLEPKPDCPSPQVVKTNDPCACPYVVCSNNINPLDLPEKNLQKSSKNYCEFKGNKIEIGKEFYDSCRAICRCDIGATLNCKPIQCSHNFGPHTHPNCLEWDIDPHFMPIPPNCCPQPKCKNDGSCSFAGIRFANHIHIPQELLPCGKKCICDNGQIHCENMCPEIPDDPPLGLPCPSSMAFRGHLPGDKCCIHWQCQNIYQDKIKGNCVYNDKRFKLGEQWDETDTGIKRRCQCKITNGILHVVCNPGGCQPITERFLEPSVECPTPTVIVPKDAIMCPYVICNNTREQGGQLESVDVVAINATSARIRFTIPSLYVGLLGHAEVHYTTDINTPRHQWNIQKFARPKRLFDIPNIEYHLGNLKPDTIYFLQIEVIIEALKSGPLSEIYKLYLPPLPVTTPPTTTTVASTLPPIIMLDMHLDAQAIDSNSAKVTWRLFTTQEKKFIDGIQIRYKKANHDSDKWNYSQVLHRNIQSYILDHLEPGLTYAIDLIFNSIEGINTNIVSTKPVLVDVPFPPKDEFQFDPRIYPDDVMINENQIDIELRNIPKPVDKFITVTKFYYQNVATSELMYHFINLDESGKVSFTNLQPNTRYKIWIDLYLKNGQVVSSNSLDIITNYIKQDVLKDNDAGALMSNHFAESKYLLSFLFISSIVFVSGVAFMVVTCVFLRKHSTAAISRACISEAAYDNPTYKTFESGEKCMDDSLSKSSTIPAK